MSPNKVKAIRAKSGLSQASFAAWLGISKRTLQDWEQGNHAPRASAIALLKLAESGAIKRNR